MTNTQSPLGRILVGIDYSELSEIALKLALRLAERMGPVELHPVAIAEKEGPRLPEELTSDVKQNFLDEATKTLGAYVTRVTGELPANVTLAPHVAFGDPKKRLLERALAVNAELIVLGTHGRRGIERLFLGSVAENVVRGASCPVLIVRHDDKTAEAVEGSVPLPHRIAVAVDFSASSRLALLEGERWARLFDAELLILHVLEPAHFVSGDALAHLGSVEAPIEDYTRDHARERLEQFWRSTIKEPLPKLRAEVREGIVVDALLRALAEHGSDWLVMGTHGRRGVKRALLGSAAEGVMRQCPCPFIAVKSEDAES